jgi:hypothetical protein
MDPLSGRGECRKPSCFNTSKVLSGIEKTPTEAGVFGQPLMPPELSPPPPKR